MRVEWERDPLTKGDGRGNQFLLIADNADEEAALRSVERSSARRGHPPHMTAQFNPTLRMLVVKGEQDEPGYCDCERCSECGKLIND